MSARSYSDIIRHERERRGMDLSEVSRRLHIRPDILNAIEKGDFDHMPARGYSKSMVRAYARALGLDEQRITDMFLEEVQGHELGISQGRSGARRLSSRSSSSRERVPREDRSALSSRGRQGDARGAGYGERPRSSYGDSREERSYQRPSRSSSRAADAYGHPRSTDFSRSAVDGSRANPVRSGAAESSYRRGSSGFDAQSGSSNASRRYTSATRNRDARAGSREARSNGRDGRRASQQGSSAKSKGSIASAAIGAIPSLFGGRSRQDGKVPRTFSTIGSTPPYAQQGKPSGVAALEGINLALVLAIVAALIIILIVAVIISNGAKQSSEDVPSIPISGLTDTSSPEDEQQAVTALSAPTQVVFAYTVKDGQQAWIEVYLDGSSTATVATVESGPATKEFEVSGTLRFTTANPDGVTCTLDGEEVELVKDSSGGYSYEADFSAYLKQWKADNGVDDAEDSTAATNGSSGASSAATSTRASTNDSSGSATSATTGASARSASSASSAASSSSSKSDSSQ